MPVTHRDVVVSWWGEVGDGPSAAGWQHDLVFDERVLKHQTVNITSSDVTADLRTEEHAQHSGEALLLISNI